MIKGTALVNGLLKLVKNRNYIINFLFSFHFFFSCLLKNGTCPALSDDVKFEEISRACSNFSGADCDQLVYLASKEAIREVIHNCDSTDSSSTLSSDGTTTSETNKEVKRLVAKTHFSAALKKIKPSISIEVSHLTAGIFSLTSVLSV